MTFLFKALFRSQFWAQIRFKNDFFQPKIPKILMSSNRQKKFDGMFRIVFWNSEKFWSKCSKFLMIDFGRKWPKSAKIFFSCRTIPKVCLTTIWTLGNDSWLKKLPKRGVTWTFFLTFSFCKNKIKSLFFSFQSLQKLKLWFLRFFKLENKLVHVSGASI